MVCLLMARNADVAIAAGATFNAESGSGRPRRKCAMPATAQSAAASEVDEEGSEEAGRMWYVSRWRVTLTLLLQRVLP